MELIIIIIIIVVIIIVVIIIIIVVVVVIIIISPSQVCTTNLYISISRSVYIHKCEEREVACSWYFL